MKGLILAAAFAAGLSLPVITGGAGAATVRITVPQYSVSTEPYFVEAAKAFEAANPQTIIEIEVVPWDVLLVKLTSDLAAGTNADLAVIDTRWLIDRLKREAIEPLDGYISEEFRSRFIDAFLTPAILEGKTYGLPIAASARALYYNKDLFAKAGIPAPPKTWDELKTAAGKISALGGDVRGYGLQGKGEETDVYFYYALWGQGVDILDENGRSSLSSDGALAAANLYKELIDTGAAQASVTSLSRRDVESLFKEGKLGMMIAAPFLLEEIGKEFPKLNYGVAAIPAGPTGARATYAETHSIILFANSKSKEDAWKFLDYLFTTGMRARFTQGEGFLPVIKEEAKMDYYANNADLSAFIELLPQARFAPLVPGWEQAAERTGEALRRVYQGGDAGQVLKAAADDINRILRK